VSKRYLIRRLLLVIPTLLGTILLVYSLVFLMPGDPIRRLAGSKPLPESTITAIKEAYMRSGLEHLKEAEEKNKWDPPTLFAFQRDAVVRTAREHIALFGGSGRAW